MSNLSVIRAYPLEDIAVRSGGDGRTVEAYAAMFDKPTEIRDHQGHYYEILRSTTFDKTLAESFDRIQVFYNHGMDLFRQPAAEYAMPIGRPVEIKADARGLFTVTRYSATPLADQVLELIKDGSIRAMSWSGEWIPGKYTKVPAARAGEPFTVVRTEARLKEYGPTPIPADHDAAIVGVRNAALLAAQIQDLDPEQREELLGIVQATTDLPAAGDGAGPGQPEPDDTSTPAADEALDEPKPSLRLLAAEQATRRRRR